MNHHTYHQVLFQLGLGNVASSYILRHHVTLRGRRGESWNVSVFGLSILPSPRSLPIFITEINSEPLFLSASRQCCHHKALGESRKRAEWQSLRGDDRRDSFPNELLHRRMEADPKVQATRGRAAKLKRYTLVANFLSLTRGDSE